MNIRLPCGQKAVPVDVPDNWINGRCYRSHRFEAAGDERAEVLAALAAPKGVDSFSELVKDRKDAVIAIDSSAPILFEEVLPAFLEELEDNSPLTDDNITILLTNNYWNPLKAENLSALVPSHIRDHYRVILHNPFDAGMSKDLGTLFTGAPLHVNKIYADAALKVIMGPVQPDLIFGFSGGRSLVVPGLSDEIALREIFKYENVANPAVVYGALQNNPFNMAAFEALQKVGCDLNVSTLMTADGKVSEVIIGHPGQSFMAAVNAVREKMKVTVKEKMDIVVTGGGGAPYDNTLYQLVNSLSAALPVLKDDGTIVVTADLSGGVGPDPLSKLILKSGGPRGFEEKYGKSSNFVPGQWIAQRYFQLLADHEVIVFSDGMKEDDLWTAGMTPTANIQDAIEVAMQGHGQRCKIVALPDGPFSLATLDG